MRACSATEFLSFYPFPRWPVLTSQAGCGDEKSPPRGPTCELVHNRVVRIELIFPNQHWENPEMTTAATRNLEIPIGICIAGVVYFALLYSVISYLG